MYNSVDVPETVTVSREHSATVEEISDLLSDPVLIPQWAPRFADKVSRGRDGGWTAERGGKSFPFHIDSVPAVGVVDVLRHDPRGRGIFGARFRIMPRNAGGSVVTMTMATFDDDVTASSSAAGDELAAVLELLDQHRSRPATR